MRTTLSGARAVSAIGAVCVLATYATQAETYSHDPLAAQALRLTVWCIGMLIWPHVWLELASGCDGAARFGLLWPFLVMLHDTHPRQHTLRSSAGGSVQIEPSVLYPAIFALAGLVGASRDTKHLRIFVAPILLMVCVVLPRTLAPDASEEGDVQTLSSAVQRVALACAVGLLLSGILYKGGGRGLAID